MLAETLTVWTPRLFDGQQGPRVEVYTCPGTGHLSQDGWFAMPFLEGWRLAAIDGVTPAGGCRPRAGVDGAVHAASVITGALRAPTGLGEALAAANAELHDPSVQPTRDQAMADVAAADVVRGPRGGLNGTVVTVGDCEAWVRRGDALELIAGGDNLWPQSRKLWRDALGDAMPWDHIDLEARLIDGPEHRRTNSCGRYPTLRAEFAVVTDCEELILASDGARLSEFREAGSWVPGLLEEWLQVVATRSARDDLTVVRILP